MLANESNNTNQYNIQPSAEDDHRQVTPDPKDCEDIWKIGLDDYILRTRQRQEQIEDWFEANIRVRIFDLLTLEVTSYKFL
jgi:hypothetical protein